MKCYRLKHIPTGLYFKPGRTNLGKKGKLYKEKPSKSFYSLAKLDWDQVKLFQDLGYEVSDGYDHYVKIPPEDIEIIVYDTDNMISVPESLEDQIKFYSDKLKEASDKLEAEKFNKISYLGKYIYNPDFGCMKVEEQIYDEHTDSIDLFGVAYNYSFTNNKDNAFFKFDANECWKIPASFFKRFIEYTRLITKSEFSGNYENNLKQAFDFGDKWIK